MLLHVRTLIFTAHTYYFGSYLIKHHIYELNSARTGFIQVYKTRTTFGNPDQIWQPKVVRGRTNFGSEKWSARTTFCPDQFSRDRCMGSPHPLLDGSSILRRFQPALSSSGRGTSLSPARGVGMSAVSPQTPRSFHTLRR